jgi:hypothetical protein
MIWPFCVAAAFIVGLLVGGVAGFRTGRRDGFRECARVIGRRDRRIDLRSVPPPPPEAA